MENIRRGNDCKFTFMIGNGFDLNLGMKTRYSDMYDDYIYEPTMIAYIDDFKETLQKQDPYNKWGDFEIGMAEYAKEFSSEKELVECVRDFKRYLVNYLQEESNRLNSVLREIKNYGPIQNELYKSLRSFYSKLIPNDIYTIESIIAERPVDINVITFNYTNCLEWLLSRIQQTPKLSFSTPIHIHGRLGEDVVLGVDNLTQFKNLPYALTKKGKRSFIKTEFNEQYDRARLEKAKKVLLGSDIICVFGFAMGKTDQMWVDLIIEWLLQSPNHHLVFFKYDENKYYRYNSDEIMDIEEENKLELLGILGIKNEDLLSQIHIPTGFSIFDFEDIRNKMKYLIRQ